MAHWPPRYTGGGPIKRAPKRFSVLKTLDGYEVIDSDGRPVEPCERHDEASAFAENLNQAAWAGLGHLTEEWL